MNTHKPHSDTRMEDLQEHTAHKSVVLLKKKCSGYGNYERLDINIDYFRVYTYVSSFIVIIPLSIC